MLVRIREKTFRERERERERESALPACRIGLEEREQRRDDRPDDIDMEAAWDMHSLGRRARRGLAVAAAC